MSMKLYPFVIVATLALSACSTQSRMEAEEKPSTSTSTSTMTTATSSLQEVMLDTSLTSLPEEGITDWIQAFTTENVGVTRPRVVSFNSAEGLRADTLARLAFIPNVTNPQKIADTMAVRAEKAVNFAQSDLIVVYLTAGGPPFGNYRITQTAPDSLEFCIDKVPNPAGISGMSLKTEQHFYSVPKGMKVFRCLAGEAR